MSEKIEKMYVMTREFSFENKDENFQLNGSPRVFTTLKRAEKAIKDENEGYRHTVKYEMRDENDSQGRFWRYEGLFETDIDSAFRYRISEVILNYW